MKKLIKIYLSGPMNGYPNFNYDRFNYVASLLRKQGYIVINPVELQGEPTDSLIDINGNSNVTIDSWIQLLSRDIKVILDEQVDAIVLLDGWEKSNGAKAEIFIVQQILKGAVYKFKELDSGFCLNKLSIDIDIKESL